LSVSADANRVLIERLYDALDRGDGETMSACYAPDANFEDPAFGKLHGDQIGGMWRMLTSRATNLSVELRSHDADEESGSANWVATYTFTSTGRPVVNDVQAKFEFDNGLIVDHLDEFDFRRWASQAFGRLPGNAIALLPPLRARARHTADAQLAEYLANEG
jgi:ketosteroid isomerase-like protein